jgi:signal transduction histidine kinase
VQAETARETTPDLSAAGAQRLAEIAGTARAGLTEMRRLLGVLREDAGGAAARHPQPGLPQLAELIDAARETSAAGTRLIVSGPVAAFDPGVELAAYRIVQEALTNASRHANAKQIKVTIERHSRDVQAVIEDDGVGFDRRKARRRGLGLLGMEERVREIGGTLDIKSQPGRGTRISVLLPVPEEQHELSSVNSG